MENNVTKISDRVLGEKVAKVRKNTDLRPVWVEVQPAGGGNQGSEHVCEDHHMWMEVGKHKVLLLGSLVVEFEEDYCYRTYPLAVKTDDKGFCNIIECWLQRCVGTGVWTVKSPIVQALPTPASAAR